MILRAEILDIYIDGRQRLLDLRCQIRAIDLQLDLMRLDRTQGRIDAVLQRFSIDLKGEFVTLPLESILNFTAVNLGS